MKIKPLTCSDLEEPSELLVAAYKLGAARALSAVRERLSSLSEGHYIKTALTSNSEERAKGRAVMVALYAFRAEVLDAIRDI